MLEFISTPVVIWMVLILGCLSVAVIKLAGSGKPQSGRELSERNDLVFFFILLAVLLAIFGAWPAFYFSGMEAAAAISRAVTIAVALILVPFALISWAGSSGAEG